MKILIVDDEAPARDRMRRMVTEIGGHEIVGEAANGREALERAGSLNPDVVLMDIRMPDIDGLEAARHLLSLDTSPAVIFTTAYGEHALEAFDAQAVAYLLKPVAKDKLEEAFERASKITAAQLQALHDGDSPLADQRSHICARVRGGLQLVPVEDIVYFQADHKYVTVKSLSDEVLIEESLKSLEAEFENKFIRIHRNALVSMSFLEGLEKTPDGRYQAKLRSCDDKLDISRRHVSSVRRKLMSL